MKHSEIQIMQPVPRSNTGKSLQRWITGCNFLTKVGEHFVDCLIFSGKRLDLWLYIIFLSFQLSHNRFLQTRPCSSLSLISPCCFYRLHSPCYDLLWPLGGAVFRHSHCRLHGDDEAAAGCPCDNQQRREQGLLIWKGKLNNNKYRNKQANH